MLLQFQPEPLLPAQELPLMHDASVCTSKSSAVAREERRIGHLPPRTEACRLSTFGLRKRSWLSGTRRQARNEPTAPHRARGAGVGGGCGGCSRMQGPQRSPPPGPQPVGGAVYRVRRRRRLEASRIREPARDRESRNHRSRRATAGDWRETYGLWASFAASSIATQLGLL